TLYTNIGQIYYNLGNYTEAVNFYNQLNKYLKSKDVAGYKTLLFLAQIHYHFGDEAQAKADLDLFERKFGNSLTIPRYIDVFREAANLHLSLNQLSQAVVYYKKWGNLKDSL